MTYLCDRSSYAVAAKGCDGARPLRAGGSASGRTWSPDSGALAFAGIAPGGDTDSDLYIVPRTGGALMHLTATPGVDWLPRWLERTPRHTRIEANRVVRERRRRA